MTVVVGTAGHIDHGKTALLRALTGIDPDRLPEEHRRGMTIDVGYAHLDLADGRSVDFVDVPGHDRLIGNMLVGAGEIDAAMLVVAADDGPRAQTIEHLELLDALGIRAGLVVITKTDLVDDDRLAEAENAVRALVDATTLSGAAIVRASSTTGAGIEAVREAVLDVAERASPSTGDAGTGDPPRLTGDPPRLTGDPPRLAVDRVFAVRGRGVVVTGTLRGGPVRRGDELRIEPATGQRARVREVQVHGRTVETAEPGRVALNLAGIDGAAVSRGLVLTTDPAVRPSDRLLVALAPAASLRGEPTALPHDRARLRFHAATDQVGASVGRSASTSVALPTGEVTAIVRLDRPVAARPGDRFVLRRSSPGRTEAGGRILDIRPPRGAARRRLTPERLVAVAMAFGPAGSDGARLDLHGVIEDGPTIRLAPDVGQRLETSALAIVAAHHDADPGSPGIPLVEIRSALATELRRLAAISRDGAAIAVAAVVDRIVASGGLARTDDVVHAPGRAATAVPPGLEAAMGELERRLDVPAPPPLDEAARAAACPPEGVRLLEAADRIVRVADDLAWAAAAWHRLASVALEMAGREPLAPAALRDATSTSRKYVMALLEDLDRRQILRRTPSGHVPGPRAAALGSAPLPPVSAGTP